MPARSAVSRIRFASSPVRASGFVQRTALPCFAQSVDRLLVKVVRQPDDHRVGLGVRDRLLEVGRPLGHALRLGERARALLRPRVHDLHAVAIPLPVQGARVEEADQARAEHRRPVSAHVFRATSRWHFLENGPRWGPRLTPTLRRRVRCSNASRARRARSSEASEICADDDRRRRARALLRHGPFAHPRRGDVPALRLVSRLQPDRGAVADFPHAGRGRERTAAGDVPRARRGAGGDDPRELPAASERRADGLQRRRHDRRPDRDGPGRPRARAPRDRRHLRRALARVGLAALVGHAPGRPRGRRARPLHAGRRCTGRGRRRARRPGLDRRRRRARERGQGADRRSSSSSAASCLRF